MFEAKVEIQWQAELLSAISNLAANSDWTATSDLATNSEMFINSDLAASSDLTVNSEYGNSQRIGSL
jgi:hypothetical protein